MNEAFTEGLVLQALGNKLWAIADRDYVACFDCQDTGRITYSDSTGEEEYDRPCPYCELGQEEAL